jgi:hypothetical protein
MVVEDNLKWYKAFKRRRTYLLILIPISFFILWLVRLNTDIAENVFARGIYRWLSQGVSLISGIFPFSLMEIEIIATIIFIAFFILNFLWRIIKRIHRRQGGIGYELSLGLLNTGCIIGVVFFVYLMMGGTNYYRYPFSDISGYQIKESSVDDLYKLCLSLADQAADLRTQLHSIDGAEDEGGVLQLSDADWNEVTNIAEKSYIKLSKEYPVLGGYYISLKPVFFSDFMSKMEITGIFWPFTSEANVNVNAAEYSIPATIGHELAHQRGFMREDEANFISYLVCKNSDNLKFQYSGIMLALTYAGNQLYKQNSDLYDEVRKEYTTEMVADLRDEYYYWKKFEDTTISVVSNTMNDNYLKANKQSDGVKSYGRMVDLLLAEYHNNNQ